MNNPEPARVSIWSVATEWLPAYLISFSVLGTIGVGYAVWYNIWELTTDSLHETIRGIISDIVTVGIASAIISVLALEMGKNAMIAGTYFERLLERRRASELDKRFEEGRAENDAKWRAWNDRRLAAEAKGEPFDEPPPGLEE